METVDKIIIRRKTILPEVIDSLHLSKSNNVLLVIEEDSDIGASVVSLKLISEKAEGLGKRVAILSIDKVALATSKNANLPCIDDERSLTNDLFGRVVRSNASRAQVVPKPDSEDKLYVPVPFSGEVNKSVVVPKSNSSCHSKMAENVQKLDVREEGGFKMAVGGDIKTLGSGSNTKVFIEKAGIKDPKGKKFFVGKDWSRDTKQQLRKGDEAVSNESYIKKGGVKNLLKNSSKGKFNLALLLQNRGLIIGVIVGLISGGLWFANYYFLVPEVNIILYPENIEVSFTGEVLATESANGIDIDNKLISSKEEKLTEDDLTLSLTGDTTGVSYDGAYAVGVVTIYNLTDEAVNIPGDTTLSVGDLSFHTSSDVVVPARQDEYVAGEAEGVKLTASEYGAEYNTGIGSNFTISGFDSNKVAAKSTSAFTGGSKVEIRTVVAADITKVGKELDSKIKEMGNKRFKDIHENDEWILVADSIKYEYINPDEPYKSFEKEGEESDIVNVSVQMKATALYYNHSELDSLVSELMNADYRGRTDSNENAITAVLTDDYVISITIKSFEGTTIVLDVDSNGIMRTEIEEIQIVAKLQKASWTEGVDFLNELPHMRKNAKIEFTPENYPYKLKHFPKSDKKITVKIDTTVSEDQVQ